MTGADLMVVGAIIAIAWILWRQEETEHWRDWLIKTLLISSLLAGPYFFADELTSYWRSSSDGPVNIEAGWW